MDYKTICRQTEEAVREAGLFIAGERKTFSWDKVEFKGVHNMVSYVDKTAERMLVASLGRIVPDAGFITEEGTATESGERYRWVIDPLDGTTNFIHGLPPYCVSVALMDGAETVVGVVYEITIGEMFSAWKDGPATMNGNPISASKVSSMDNALIGVGFSYAALTNIDGYLQKVADYQLHSDGIRRVGSAAADLAYVACGRLDAFSQINLAPWDVAAGAFIARRAGAVVSDFSRGDDYVFGRRIVAAAPAVYDEFIATVG